MKNKAIEIVYKLSSHRYCVDGIVYTGYGIICECQEDSFEFPDLSIDETTVMELIALLNTMKPQVAHLPFILDDFLQQMY